MTHEQPNPNRVVPTITTDTSGVPFAALRAEYPGRFASPERIAELSRERFKPWPLLKPPTPKVRYADGNREPKP